MNIVLVKNMLCHRCMVSVEDILNNAAVPFHKVIFGEIHLTNEISREQKETLVENLKNEGFELIESQCCECKCADGYCSEVKPVEDSRLTINEENKCLFPNLLIMNYQNHKGKN